MSDTSITFVKFVGQFGGLINSIIAVLAAVAVLLFMAGLMRYVFNISGDTKKVQEGKGLIGWGLLALFVLFCIGGILNFFAYDFFGKTVYKSGTVPTADSADPDRAFIFEQEDGVQADDPDEAFDFSDGGVFPGNNVFPGNAVLPGNAIQTGDGAQTDTCAYNAQGQYVCSGFSNDCVLDNRLVPHGSSAVFYSSQSVEPPYECSVVAQTRTCNNGVLSGHPDYRFAYCSNMGGI